MLNENEREIIEKTVQFVKRTLAGAEGGHDWFHTQRVWNNAKLIAGSEDVNPFVVELAALLHDIANAKFHDGNEAIGAETTGRFLKSLNVSEDIVGHVVHIVRNMSFRKQLDGVVFSSPEMLVVQDADRLDAIGAVGIGRAFSFGGFKNRAMYDPDIKPETNITGETYRNSNAPTINHFYEKLLLLKDMMNTETAKRIAANRHLVMERFLDDFLDEWHGLK